MEALKGNKDTKKAVKGDEEALKCNWCVISGGEALRGDEKALNDDGKVLMGSGDEALTGDGEARTHPKQYKGV